MPTQAEINYLNALHQQEINKYLTAYNNATPEQKAAINQTINPTTQPVAPPTQQTAAPNPTDATPNSAGQLVSDGQGGFIPVGTGAFDGYGLISQTNKTVDSLGHTSYTYVFRTPQGLQSFGGPEENARQYAQQLGVPFSPIAAITGTATQDQLNSFHNGTNADGTPATSSGGSSGSSSTNGTDSSLDKGALAYLTDLLKKYGLDSLAPWAMDMLKSGASQYEIIQQLRERPEYEARFSAMDGRRSNGLGALSEEEYIAFENTAKDYMQRAGVQPWAYDQPEDFKKIIEHFANVGQVADRLEKVYQEVAQSPPETLREMEKWFGVGSYDALFTWALDPEENLPKLIKAAQQGVIGGYGLRQGLDISQNQAGNLADMGFTTQQIQSGMQQAGTMAGLQNQTVDEAAAKAAGLTADTIAGGVFGADAATTQDLKNRLGTRKAQFDTRGTAGATQKGAFGLEAAR